MGDRTVTYGELYWWLASGNGDYRITNCPHVLFSSICCVNDDTPVEGVLIRKWSDPHFHIPTRRYMGLETNCAN